MTTDAVRVVMQPNCRGLTLDGQKLNARDGHVTVTGPRAAELKRVADTLPGQMWSAAGTQAAEIRCRTCRKGKLALFGPLCPWCGGACD